MKIFSRRYRTLWIPSVLLCSFLLSCSARKAFVINPEFRFMLPPKELSLEFERPLKLFLDNAELYVFYFETEGVKKWKDYFLNNAYGREIVSLLFERQGRMRKLMRHLRENDIPEEFAFLAFIESYLNDRAVSRKGASGTWQFMKHTASRSGLYVSWWCDERFNLEKSTLAAINYLKKLYAIFNDWQLVVLAYNYGENGVQRALEMFGTEEMYAHLPRETRDFLLKIKALVQLFGDYEFIEAEEEDTVLHPFYDLWLFEDIAEGLKIKKKVLQDLNPEYRAGMVMKGCHYLRIPAAAASRLPLLKKRNGKSSKILKVKIQKGDTVYGIARRYNVNFKKLLSVNSIQNPRKIKPGQELIVPLVF